MMNHTVLTQPRQKTKPRAFTSIIATLLAASIGMAISTQAAAATCNGLATTDIANVNSPPRLFWSYFNAGSIVVESTNPRGLRLPLTGRNPQVLLVKGTGYTEIDARNLTGSLTICVTENAEVDVIAGFGSLWFSGGAGADLVIGVRARTATIMGNGGDDLLIGSNNDDFIDGGEGNDFIAGGLGMDDLYGGNGADVIIGGQADRDPFKMDDSDYIEGGDGEDIIMGSAGFDIIEGNSKKDLIALYALKEKPNSHAAEGANSFFTPEFFLRASWEKADDNDSDGGRVDGGSSADTIHGSEGDDYINGGSGNDVIHGYGGNDIIQGSTGKDEIHGGEGNDTLALGIFNRSGERLDFLRGIGLCFLCPRTGGDYASVNGGGDADGGVIFGDGGDDDIYGSHGGDWLEGNAGQDVLIGFDGGDTLQGGTASDTLLGGGDDDVLRGGGSPDACYERDGGPEGCDD